MAKPLPANLGRMNDKSVEYLGIDFFFDFDGTLAPITTKPEEARMPAPVHRNLERLIASPGVSVSIVSGRALNDLRHRVALKGVCLAGNHGLEIHLGDREYIHSQGAALRPALVRIAGLLVENLGTVPGCRIEDKGLTVSVHYREAMPASVAEILRTVEEVLASPASCNLFTLRAGKMVAEVRPLIGWDKGQAVLWIMEHRRGPGWVGRYMPVYVGDDDTDEDAFTALAGKGLTVKVGDDPTAAEFFIKNTDIRRLFNLFGRLTETIQGRDQVGTTPRD